MSATVTIMLNGATATSNVVSLTVEQATIGLSFGQGLVAAIPDVTNMSVTSGRVAIATAPGSVFEGSLAVSLELANGADPVVTLDNLVPARSPPTVTWPTANSMAEQALMSGNPLILAGIVNT